MLFARERFDDADPGESLLHRHHHLAHVLLLALDRFAGAFAINAERHQAAREKHQGDEGEFPIHVEQHADAADDRDRLLEEVAADAVESAVCIMRVSFVMRDMRKPDRILLKKSIEWRIILLKSWLRMSVSTLLLTQFM